jgi:altronate hydrolase
MGYPRAGNRFGVRNTIAVVSTVNCSAQSVQAIAGAFTPEILADFPNVDGVVAITHSYGCSGPIGDLSYRYLQRTLLNLARQPNIGGIVYVSLGCEVNQMADLVSAAREQANENDHGTAVVGPFLTIQDEGGIAKTVSAGIKAVKEMLPRVNAIRRVPAPLSGLSVALQCGGSDGWSGVTANPLVGRVADEIVRGGGTVVLAETPEIYGAEHLLTSRAASEQVGQKLIERIQWWQAQAELLGFSLDNNPSPGNKAGGLTTIYEKSLGAVAKGGSTPLMDVVEYAGWIDSKGLVFMDTPGNDPASVTGQVAGGCNLVLFTTGRGSVFGGNLAPCIKIASNSDTYRRMVDDMDYNAGVILEGKTFDEATAELLEQVIAVASGAPTKSEGNPYRQAEFIPWHIGVTL